MSALKSVPATVTLSRQAVAATIDDALTFLRTVGSEPSIRAALASAGYSDADSEQGWALARSVILLPKEAVVTDNPVATATAEIDAWRTTGFAIAHSALARLHPEQEAFLFEGLDLGHAAECVLTASIFLERCTQLEGGNDRKATHKADLAALATLESRGLTAAKRKRLRALVTLVETQAAPLPESVTPSADERASSALELRAWLVDWRTVAKVVITRRDWLRRLGIGKRRSRKTAAAPAVPPPPPVVAPPGPSPVDEVSGPQSRAA